MNGKFNGLNFFVRLIFNSSLNCHTKQKYKFKNQTTVLLHRSCTVTPAPLYILNFTLASTSVVQDMLSPDPTGPRKESLFNSDSISA